MCMYDTFIHSDVSINIYPHICPSNNNNKKLGLISLTDAACDALCSINRVGDAAHAHLHGGGGVMNNQPSLPGEAEERMFSSLTLFVDDTFPAAC